MNRWTVLIAALVLWTLLSFGWLTIFSGGSVCKILGVVPPAGSGARIRPTHPGRSGRGGRALADEQRQDRPSC